MKRIAPALVLAVALFALLGAGGTASRSGLRGRVLVTPSTPVCVPGMSCARPAAHVLLKFWAKGQVMAHARTDGKGRFRIALRSRAYTVTAGLGASLIPARITVATHGFRRVTFRLDTGVR